MPDIVEIPSPSAIVVGGGIAGLVLADKLTAAGVHVVLFEKEKKVGGLARSLVYGDYTFDIGPKRFHTYSARIESYLRNVLGMAYRTIGRRSSVYLLGKLHPWPLEMSSVFKLPPQVLFKCLADLFRKPPFDGESFSSYILSRYGKTLYEIFFRDYTRKFCHVEPERLHESWARASIHRAIIDKRYKQGTLFEVAKVAMLPKKATTRFLYPIGGMDKFHQALVTRIEKQGGEIHVDAEIRLSGAPGSIPYVEVEGKAYKSDRVFWSGPVTQAYNDLIGGRPKKKLRYLTLALLNIEAKAVNHDGNQWTYFSSPDFILTRTSYPYNFDPSLVPPDMGSLVAEITIPEGEESMPWEDWEKSVLEELEIAKICRREDVVDIHRELIPYSYPLYELHYQKRMKLVENELEAFPGLILAGRTGKFWYNNMDDSIEDSLNLAEAAIADWRKNNLV